MMRVDAEPFSPAMDGVQADLVVPDTIRPGEPAHMVYHLSTSDGKPLTDLTPSHEEWIHLVTIRDDLTGFQHLHPQPTGTPGELAVDVIFPAPGRYAINSEFRRRGAMHDIVFRQYVDVVGTPVLAGLDEDRTSKVIDGVRVDLVGSAMVGAPSEFHFIFSDAATGQPITDLKPYLSAAGHVIVASQGLYTIEHGHAEAEDASGAEIWPLPGATFGPEMSFYHTFGAPGLYRLWGQFQTSDGRLISADFVVRASQ
ncbi:MAG: hypothetical protein JOZ87_06180 [Chloroflexi bacterium]|nr:hypothetical protein [Chloroflexota bacterium]